MPEDPKAGMIQAFLDSYTGKYVCTQLLFRDALKNEFGNRFFKGIICVCFLRRFLFIT